MDGDFVAAKALLDGGRQPSENAREAILKEKEARVGSGRQSPSRVVQKAIDAVFGAVSGSTASQANHGASSIDREADIPGCLLGVGNAGMRPLSTRAGLRPHIKGIAGFVPPDCC